MRVQVAVTEFQVSGCVRLIFKPLLPYFPLFGAIEISLASKPEVDFDLRVIGSDITLVPGALYFV
jgi:Ca2+-dependent lipid-binding protein